MFIESESEITKLLTFILSKSELPRSGDGNSEAQGVVYAKGWELKGSRRRMNRIWLFARNYQGPVTGSEEILETPPPHSHPQLLKSRTF